MVRKKAAKKTKEEETAPPMTEEAPQEQVKEEPKKEDAPPTEIIEQEAPQSAPVAPVVEETSPTPPVQNDAPKAEENADDDARREKRLKLANMFGWILFAAGTILILLLDIMYEGTIGMIGFGSVGIILALAYYLRKKTKTPKKKETKEYVPFSDPEPLLNLLMGLPAIFISLGIIAFIFLMPQTVSDIMAMPIFELLIYALSNIGDSVSILILSIFGTIFALSAILFYEVVWRVIFPDWQIAFMFEREIVDPKDPTKKVKKPVLMPRSKEGRIYMMVGYGKLDAIYRKRTNAPVPRTKILFVRRGLFTPRIFNPFSPLSSCDKIYVDDPDNKRYSKSGVWKRTIRGAHLKRDFEGNAEVYHLVEEAYDQPVFSSGFYEDKYKAELKTGMIKVTSACRINPDIQQDQMRRNMLYVPQSEVDDDRRLAEERAKREAKN